jgi:hypothetical protein
MSTPGNEKTRGPGLVTFRVGLRLPPVKGGGRLTVERGSIVLETDRVTRALSRVTRIVHTDRHVTLVKARLAPPWFNTALVLHDDDVSGYVVTWLGARDRLRDALRAAGFQVQEVTTWFSLAPRTTW